MKAGRVALACGVGVAVLGMGASSVSAHHVQAGGAVRALTAASADAPVPVDMTTVKPGALLSMGGDIASLRTRTSKTFLTTTGEQVLVETGASLNYKDASGNWQPVDPTLVANGSGYTNRAAGFTVQIPTSLSSPVSVSKDGLSASFALQGASGSAVVSGQSATFASALNGVDVRYSSLPDLLKESLVLKSAAAPSSFVFSLQLGSGLSAVQDGDGIDFTQADGSTVFSFAPPFMTDASGAVGPVKMSLAGTAGAYTVSVVADAGWLGDAGRAFPVTVDPTVSFNGPYRDCSITDNGSSSSCGSSTLQLGSDGTHTYRALLNFPRLQLSIPWDAVVTGADLHVNAASGTTGNTITARVDALTQNWASGANWTTYDGSHSWANAGGDHLQTSPSESEPVVVGQSAWTTLYPLKLTQSWGDGSITEPLQVTPGGGPEAALMLLPTDLTNNVVSITSWESANQSLWPYLVVDYQTRMGERDPYRFETVPVTDRQTLGVDVANGNVLLDASDVQINDLGLSVAVSRTFNSFDDQFEQFGMQWRQAPAGAMRLTFDGFKEVTFWDASGDPEVFWKNGLNQGDSYTSPPGIDADLTQTGANTYKLVYHGSKLEYDFNLFGNDTLLQYEKDNHGTTLTYHYDDASHLNRLTSISDWDNRSVTFTYNTAGYISQISDWAGRIYAYGYDANNDLTSYTDPGGNKTQYGYDANNNLNKITTPAGRVIEIGYSGDMATSITRDDTVDGNSVTSFDWTNRTDSAQGGSTIVTDPNGHPTTYTYDNRDRITKTTDALSRATTTSYDTTASCGASDDDRVCSQTNPAGGTTNYTYSSDGHNNLAKAEGPANANGQRATESYAYTDSNNLFSPTAYTDDQGNSWSYSYDATTGDALTKAEGNAPGQNPVTFTYNTDGTTKTITDAKNTGNSACSPTTVTICFTYDATHNLQKTTYPSPAANPLGTEQFTWDSLNRLATLTDGNSNQTTYTYDGATIQHSTDRLQKVAFAGGRSVTYGYDGDGNLTSQTDSTGGTTNYVYDAQGRLHTETKPDGTVITYAYDAAGNLAAITENANTTRYAYDKINRLTGITEPGSAGNTHCPDTTQTICISYPDEFHSTITYPGNAQVQSTYDNSGRLLTITNKNGAGSTVASYSYSYTYGSGATQDGSLRHSVTTAAGTTYYCYDTVGRLLSAATGSGCPAASPSYAYSYDVNGNMTSKTASGATTYYTYNVANELCLSASSSGGSCPSTSPPWTYDGNGNLTKSPAFNQLGYNTLDQTTSITPTGANALSASYLGRGQLERTSFAGDTFLNDKLGIGRRTRGTTTTDPTRTTGGTVYAENVGGSHYYFAFDGLGSVVGLFTSSGAYVQDQGANYTAIYDPYGNLTNPPSSSYPAFDYRYADYWFDKPSGLYKVGARYYDPTTARWTQRDPIDDPFELQGWNRYDYAGDDPISATDPTGECAFCKAHVRRRQRRGISWSPVDRFHLRSFRLVQFIDEEEDGIPEDACLNEDDLIEVPGPNGKTQIWDIRHGILCYEY